MTTAHHQLVRDRIGGAAGGGIRLAIITAGPTDGTNYSYFTVKMAKFDKATGLVAARLNAAAFEVPVPCLYHRDVMADDDPDYTQPRLTTGDPLWIAQDFPGGTWLVVGHFQKSSKTCPDA